MLTIHVLAMPHREHQDHQPIVCDLADQPVIADTIAPQAA